MNRRSFIKAAGAASGIGLTSNTVTAEEEPQHSCTCWDEKNVLRFSADTKEELQQAYEEEGVTGFNYCSDDSCRHSGYYGIEDFGESDDDGKRYMMYVTVTDDFMASLVDINGEPLEEFQ